MIMSALQGFSESSDIAEIIAPLQDLKDCTLCPRNCHVNRFSEKTGYCHSGSSYQIGSVCLHHGEEPAVSGNKGICNVFFTHCNLQCVYCQNAQISRNNSDIVEQTMSLEEVLTEIISLLDQAIPALGFVSPTHFTPQVKVIIRALRKLEKNPVIVYNSNGYDKPETLRSLENMVDVFLPDFKYISSQDALSYSDAPDYPETAIKALKEMYYQKGSTVITNENGYAESGLIIRHLVIPGKTDESIRLLETIAEELSPSVWISLMSQYYPAAGAMHLPSLNRQITKKEYTKVVHAMEKIGFRNGWVQEFESPQNYRPDFRNKYPFGK
jgi:putative pyruvate formate lyase activating enzyme